MYKIIQFFILFVFSVIVEAQGLIQCRWPSSAWCSSVEIARACQVEDQCKSFVWSQNTNDDRIDLVLYYETECPDCKNFVKNQLWPTYNKVNSILNLRLVPYGNAEEVQVGDRWEFKCQHGVHECNGNLIQTCAIYLNNNTNVWFPFVACMEMSDELPESSGPNCAKQLGIDYSAVDKCTKTDIGNKLEHQMATETDALQPSHEYVPWITLNGVHTEDIQQQAQTDLTKLICDTYTGSPKPPACKATIKHSCVKTSLSLGRRHV